MVECLTLHMHILFLSVCKASKLNYTRQNVQENSNIHFLACYRLLLLKFSI